jgi:guanine deaminase
LNSTESSTIVVRGSLLHFLDDPGAGDREAENANAWQWHEDGCLWIENGRIHASGSWVGVRNHMPPAVLEAAQRFDYTGKLILPGFVDTHMHYAQADVIASFGRQLLDWLNDCTYPAEARFINPDHARQTADFVLDRLLAHGTTTASVFATSHPQSVDAFFEAAEARNLRMLCGKVMMDRECPENVRDTAASAERDSLALIERWHKRNRLHYSLTPRFAVTSTPEQLDVAGRLFKGFPDVHLQSHLAENAAECARVRELFPDARRYLDVYEKHGLLGPRAIYGHCIHLNDAEHAHLAATGTGQAFCPTSNLFLGSGAYNLAAATNAGVRVGIGTDVGGGTSYSMIRTLAEAYKVQQLHHAPLSALRGWYLATLGGARALHLENNIGNFEAGKDADFVVLDWDATADMSRRMDAARTLPEFLFAMMMMGDDRAVVATHILGKLHAPEPVPLRRRRSDRVKY